MITSWPLNVVSASGEPPYTIHCHQPARLESSKEKSPCDIPTFASQLTAKSSLSTRHAVHRLLPSTRQISFHEGLQTVSPNSHDNGLQVHLRSRSITISEFISTFTRSRPPYVSPSMLDYRLQVHLQTHSVTASKCISNYAQLRPPSPSPNMLDHSLRVCHWIHSIIIFRRTSNCAQAPPAASLDILCLDG